MVKRRCKRLVDYKDKPLKMKEDKYSQGGETMDARILVVDDEPEIADLVSVYLRGRAFRSFPVAAAVRRWRC